MAIVQPGTFTAQYTAATTALRTAAERLHARPFDVRLLIALADAGGSGTIDQVATALGAIGSQVRQALPRVEGRGWVTRPGRHGTRRGTPATLHLTSTGWHAIGRPAPEDAARAA